MFNFTNFCNRYLIWVAAFLSCFTGILVILLESNALQLSGNRLNISYFQRDYTYRNHDYPDRWPISALDQVHMSLENTVHYAFDSPEGRAEWNTTLPSGGAIIRLGKTGRPFTVGMFHQLRCLAIIREVLDEFYQDSDARTIPADRSPLVGHCMNYLRQMVLCHSDTRLENVRAAKGHGLTVPDVTHVCLDWEAVYAAAEKNFKAFVLK